MSTIRGFIYEDELAKARRTETKRGRMIIPIVLIPTPNSEWNDYMIKEDSPLNDSDAGVTSPDLILGNAKIHIKKSE